MPLTVPNFIVLGQTIYAEKSVTIFFYTLQYFGAPEGPLSQSYTNLGTGVQQGPLSNCQISSILGMAWPIQKHRKTVNYIVSTLPCGD